MKELYYLRWDLGGRLTVEEIDLPENQCMMCERASVGLVTVEPARCTCTRARRLGWGRNNRPGDHAQGHEGLEAAVNLIYMGCAGCLHRCLGPRTNIKCIVVLQA